MTKLTKSGVNDPGSSARTTVPATVQGFVVCTATHRSESESQSSPTRPEMNTAL